MEHDFYSQALQQWEEKMVKAGNLDVVRSSQVPKEPKKKGESAKRTPKPKSRPEKSE